MRLTDEQIMDIKEYLNRSIKITISSLIPRISKHGLDLIDTIKALQQENERLRAQVARIREALEQIEEHLSSAIPVEGFFENMHCCSAGRIAEDALADIDALGGKEDV